jgi:hypothetical protein
MYYDEKLIDGVWYYKNMPNAKWQPMSIFKLTNKIKRMQTELGKLNN